MLFLNTTALLESNYTSPPFPAPPPFTLFVRRSTWVLGLGCWVASPWRRAHLPLLRCRRTGEPSPPLSDPRAGGRILVEVLADLGQWDYRD